MSGSREAYDRGTSIFSPDGRLYQVEYAREAVRQGSPSVGVRTREGVVLAAARRLRSPLQDPDGVEKLHEVDAHVGVASAGLAADARRLVDVARVEAQRDRIRYGEPAGVDALAKAVSDRIQEHTQTGGARPYGAALLVGGVTDGVPQLYETDPSGALDAWRATAIGEGAGEIRAHLEAERDDPSLDAGVDLAVGALAAGADEPLDVDALAVATVSVDGPSFRSLSREERRDRLDAAGAAS